MDECVQMHSTSDAAERIAQIIRQVRFGLISHAIVCTLLLIIAITNAISSNSGGCKNPDNDPHAKQEGYACVLSKPR